MKRFFIMSVLVLVVVSVAVHFLSEGRTRPPYQDFKERLDMAPLKKYRDPLYGYVVEYPCVFRQEEMGTGAGTGHARFCYSRAVDIVLESYVTANPGEVLKCHADSVFVDVGPVYENGVRVEGYSRYAKYIRSGKTYFVLSLVYPDSYKPALGRLFRMIDEWKVLGAVNELNQLS